MDFQLFMGVRYRVQKMGTSCGLGWRRSLGPRALALRALTTLALTLGCSSQQKGAEPFCPRPSLSETCAGQCPPTPDDVKRPEYRDRYPFVYREGAATVIGGGTRHSGRFLHYDGDQLVGYSRYTDIVVRPCPHSFTIGRRTIQGGKLTVDERAGFEPDGGQLEPCTYRREFPEDAVPPIQCEPSNVPLVERESENSPWVRSHVFYDDPRYPTPESRNELAILLLEATSQRLKPDVREALRAFERQFPNVQLQGKLYAILYFNEEHTLTWLQAPTFFPEPRLIRSLRRRLLGARLRETPDIGRFGVYAHIPLSIGVGE